MLKLVNVEAAMNKVQNVTTKLSFQVWLKQKEMNTQVDLKVTWGRGTYNLLQGGQKR